MAEKEEGLLLPLTFFPPLAILLRQFSLYQCWHLHAVPKFAHLAENYCYNKNYGSKQVNSVQADPASGTASTRKEVALCKQEDGGEGMGMEWGSKFSFSVVLKLWFSSAFWEVVLPGQI